MLEWCVYLNTTKQNDWVLVSFGLLKTLSKVEKCSNSFFTVFMWTKKCMFLNTEVSASICTYCTCSQCVCYDCARCLFIMVADQAVPVCGRSFVIWWPVCNLISIWFIITPLCDLPYCLIHWFSTGFASGHTFNVGLQVTTQHYTKVISSYGNNQWATQ